MNKIAAATVGQHTTILNKKQVPKLLRFLGLFVLAKMTNAYTTNRIYQSHHKDKDIHTHFVHSLSCVQLQHSRLPCPSPSSRFCSNSCLLSWWCHPTTHTHTHTLQLNIYSVKEYFVQNVDYSSILEYAMIYHNHRNNLKELDFLSW